MEQPHVSSSYAQMRAHLATPATHGVQSRAEFEQRGDRPLALMHGTNQSANVLWQSSQTHRNGGLAGLGKANRGTLYDTGF